MLIYTKDGTKFIILTHLGHGCTRGALMGNKWKRLFFILAHLGHGWDSCTRGAREGHERGTRGALIGT